MLRPTICFLILLAGASYAQHVPAIEKKPKPVVRESLMDTLFNEGMDPADSIRQMDSIYEIRRREIVERDRSLRISGPQDDFLSFGAMISTYGRIKAPDLSEFFAVRAGRPDPKAERSNSSNMERCYLINAEADFSRRYGAFIRFGYLQRYFNTLVEGSKDPDVPNSEQTIDMFARSLVAGPVVILYSTPIFKLKTAGGLGGVFVTAFEDERSSGAKRVSTGRGLLVNFDVVGDFRFTPLASFTLDVFTQSMTTNALKTGDGKSLSEPFGLRKTPMPLSPTASSFVFGFAIGMTFYTL